MSVITHLTLNPHNFHYEFSYIFTNFLLIFFVVVDKVTSTSVEIFVKYIHLSLIISLE